MQTEQCEDYRSPLLKNYRFDRNSTINCDNYGSNKSGVSHVYVYNQITDLNQFNINNFIKVAGRPIENKKSGAVVLWNRTRRTRISHFLRPLHMPLSRNKNSGKITYILQKSVIQFT